MIKVAVAQTDPKIARKQDNLERCLQLLQTAALEGAKLVAYPECSLTGYCFSSLKEALPETESVPGASTEEFVSSCRKLGTYAIFGLLEEDDGRYFNTAVLVGPEGYIGKYRKTHMPCLGIDRFLAPGDLEYKVYQTELGVIGMVICYDLRFPEITRVLALQGAQIIAHITNLPPAATAYPDFIDRARACENRLYLLSADRVGEERGMNFLGRSQIDDFTGTVLAEASETREEIIYATIDPGESSQKRIVNIPSEYEMDLFADRRPEFYGLIAQEKEA